ncbi:MAG: glutamine--fructose-6-phosphate transaminase (isomerizing) [Deltaproteobacteria bacterium]|nr:glutamine--fructose-6-phosphate transaminase (isomerizing) [Deltaproteobacteria bacterium]
MCGISGVVGEGNVIPVLFESIRNLEYRGYDSCGMAVLGGNDIAVRKNTGGVDEVNQKERLTALQGSAGISHTRWATHGRVTAANAHPHLSYDGRFAVVHNGIINNYQELKTLLKAQGVEFQSETDTEVVAHLLANAYLEFGTVEDALRAVLKQLDGTYALAVISPHQPDHIYAVRGGSPLVLGLSPQRNFAASDVNAFLPFTRKAVYLEDGEMAVLTPQGYTLSRLADGALVTRPPQMIEWDAETSRKGGYSHYMLKEIFDQPHTLTNALHIPRVEIAALAQSIQQARSTTLMGVGTTYFVGLLGQYAFSQLAGVLVQVISSDEFPEVAVVGPGDLVVAVSQSGETYDTRSAVELAKTSGARTAAIVNVMGSTLSRLVDQVIMQGSGPEICVVSTKAALSQMLVLVRTALELGLANGRLTPQAHNAWLADLDAFPDQLQKTLNEMSGFVRNLAEKTAHFQNWLFMGRGIYYPMAMEAALKMKEVTYLHVEGIPAGFLKHGTLALVDEHFATLAFFPPKAATRLHQQTLAAVEEVKARSGPVFGIYQENDHEAAQILDGGIALPVLPAGVAPLMSLVVAQLFSYFAALKLGRAIDKPRNLAKSVTVG